MVVMICNFNSLGSGVVREDKEVGWGWMILKIGFLWYFSKSASIRLAKGPSRGERGTVGLRSPDYLETMGCDTHTAQGYARVCVCVENIFHILVAAFFS